MSRVLPFVPFNPPKPTPTRILWNVLRKARTAHILDCGCLIGPGITYHSVGARQGRSPLIYHKRHVIGCLEDIH